MLSQFDVRLNGQDVLVAVFDGHGTGRVVEYVWENLLQKVIESKWYAKDLEKALKEGNWLGKRSLPHHLTGDPWFVEL